MSASSTILHKRNSVSGVAPSVGSLSAGEIAINTADGKLFTKTVNDSVKTFINIDDHPLTLDASLSSINTQYGGNTVTSVLAGVLGGYNNDVSGAGSVVVNGENNDISGDFAIIGNGLNNTINSNGDYSAILGGKNNTLDHQESFIIGSNITSHLSGFTYVNNLSVLGKVYGDGSELTGVGGGSSSDTEVRTLTSNWESTYTTVQNNSAVSWDNSLATQYTQANFLPLSGGTLTGTLCATSDVIIGGNSQIALFVGGQTIGINTETPNEALTIVGNVSATGSIEAGTGASAALYVGQSMVGINTESPTETLSISGNAEILGSPTNGLILSAPDGSRWKLTVTNTGALSTVAV
jgi:hypothetical protein